MCIDLYIWEASGLSSKLYLTFCQGMVGFQTCNFPDCPKPQNYTTVIHPRDAWNKLYPLWKTGNCTGSCLLKWRDILVPRNYLRSVPLWKWVDCQQITSYTNGNLSLLQRSNKRDQKGVQSIFPHYGSFEDFVSLPQNGLVAQLGLKLTI